MKIALSLLKQIGPPGRIREVKWPRRTLCGLGVNMGQGKGQRKNTDGFKLYVRESGKLKTFLKPFGWHGHYTG